MIPTKIFLDLDDVCNFFTMHALAAVGCPVEARELDAFDPKWGFDIIEAANRLHEVHDFTMKSFWDAIDREVWISAPESDEFGSLLSACADLVGRKNVCILTTPTRDPECLAGKLEWIHDHFPPWMHRQYLMGPAKHLLAQPGALLIDDSDLNVKQFRIHGGSAILVPRPWNPLHKVDTKLHLYWCLDEIFNRERAT